MVTDNIKITILGGKGMLGSDLVSACRQQGLNTIVFDLPEFDITNSNHLQQAVSNAQIIVNCAAYTNVDGAESESELAYKVNAEAVGRLGALAQKTNRWLLHISTDFVFDGKLNRPYVETDSPNPINEYGRSKLAGEQLLLESGCRHCIIRIQWTYGLHGNNFLAKLLQHAKTNKTLKVVDDQIGSPTATTEVAKVICKLLQRKPQGLFHFASSGYVSRYEMAKFIFDKLSMDISLSPCKTGDYVTVAPPGVLRKHRKASLAGESLGLRANRPLNSRFDCSKIKALLNEPIKPWQVPLEHFLRQL